MSRRNLASARENSSSDRLNFPKGILVMNPDYSHKHRRHGVNVQVVTDPGGRLL
ncbi:hypothetical protein AB0E25_40980 [Streptomyces bobili]|uniref:hypothetical protein n=1 Tax=Streptomyces bobili TaxID=67280 RepID=UPI0033D1EF37